jgi:hypothetical protein
MQKNMNPKEEDAQDKYCNDFLKEIDKVLMIDI